MTGKAGNLVTSEKDKANRMNNFYSSVFTNKDLTNMHNFDERVYDQHLSEFDIAPKMVKKKLEKLNSSKPPGPKGMHPKVICELSEHIRESLYQIYRKSLHNGQLPKEWKMGWTSPIHKKRQQGKTLKL